MQALVCCPPCVFAAGEQNPFARCKAVHGGNPAPPSTAGGPAWLLQCLKAQEAVKVDIKAGGFGEKNRCNNDFLAFNVKTEYVAVEERTEKNPPSLEAHIYLLTSSADT